MPTMNERALSAELAELRRLEHVVREKHDAPPHSAKECRTCAALHDVERARVRSGAL